MQRCAASVLAVILCGLMAGCHWKIYERTWVDGESLRITAGPEGWIVKQGRLHAPSNGADKLIVAADGRSVVAAYYDDQWRMSRTEMEAAWGVGGLTGADVDGHLYIYDLRSGGKRRRLEGHHPDRVVTFALARNAPVAVSWGIDGTACAWALDRGRRLGQLKVDPPMLYRLLISDDGTMALLQSQNSPPDPAPTILWDIKQNSIVGRLEIPAALAISPDRRVVMTENGAVELPSARFITPPQGMSSAPCQFLPSGQLIAWLCSGTCPIVDIKTGKGTHAVRQVGQDPGLSPDGRWLISQSEKQDGLWTIQRVQTSEVVGQVNVQVHHCQPVWTWDSTTVVLVDQRTWRTATVRLPDKLLHN